MLTPSILLFAIGVLGAFDIAFFHTWRARLTQRPECRAEAWVHVIRGVVYAAQFALVPFVRCTGAWSGLWAFLFVIDAAVAATDVWLEPASRAPQGGLSAGEYLMHIVLSVFVGALLFSVFQATWGDWALESTLRFESHLPPFARWVMAAMGSGSFITALIEASVLSSETWSRPAPIHVRVRLTTSLDALWHFTQDHHRHRAWDHRFSRIEMLGSVVETGTIMRYEKDLGPITIRGFGRYKLHLPMRQSTFEFWSDDWRSLIKRGAGLWRYTPVRNGQIEFATSYTYTVRWGVAGLMIDRFLFRPLFQWYTEQSFARLARRHFPHGASLVLGAKGRLPAAFEELK